jgi:type II secretory pathway pseudopilin PulG
MVWGGKLFALGIVVGIIGVAGAIAAFPLYNYITAKKREKLAPEIMRLTEELSGR